MEVVKGVLAGWWFLIGVVVGVGVGMATIGGAVGLVVLVWRWVATLMSGGCQ